MIDYEKLKKELDDRIYKLEELSLKDTQTIAE